MGWGGGGDERDSVAVLGERGGLETGEEGEVREAEEGKMQLEWRMIGEEGRRRCGVDCESYPGRLHGRRGNSSLTVPGIKRPSGASHNVCGAIREKRDRQTEVKVKVGQAVLLSSPLFQPSPFCYIGGDLLLHWKATHTPCSVLQMPQGQLPLCERSYKFFLIICLYLCLSLISLFHLPLSSSHSLNAVSNHGIP